MKNPFKLFFLLVLLVASVVIAIHGLGDLPMYYSISQFAAQHEWAKIYGENAGVGRFFYGPLSLVFFYPMQLFSYGNVKSFWIVSNVLMFGGFWWGLSRLYPFLASPRFSLGWLFVWIFSIKSIHASFQSLNVQLIFMTLFIYSEILRRSLSPKKEFVAGVLPMLAAALKLYPLFLCVFYFISGSRWVKLGLLTAIVFSVGLPFLFFGVPVSKFLFLDFYSNLGNFHDVAPLTKDAVTLSLPSLIATYFSPWVGMEITIKIIKGAVLVLAAAFFIFVRRIRIGEMGPREATHAWALALALMALLNSTTRPDYFMYFVPALCSLIEIGKNQKFSLPYWLGVFSGVAFIAFIADWILGSRDLNHQLELMRLPVMGMLILSGLLFLKFRRLAKLD